jgi:release factor glutamine methyltransferase
MPDFKLRRCDRCNKYHASYVVEDPQRGKINLCYDCWSAANRELQPGTTTVTIQSLLANHPKKIPRIDLQTLLAHLLGQPRAWVLAHPEAALTEQQTREWKATLAHLRRGKPLPYVLGHWEFFGLEFIVTPAVLIPRPETELLVETALSWINKAGSAIRTCIDAGTGSGCIAIALALHAPSLALTATDISPEALAIAHANAEKHGVASRIELLEADLLDHAALTNRRFDLLVANLPYIPSWTLRTLEIYEHEPALALNGGPDGLAVIRRLLQSAPAYVAAGGVLLLEIEASKGTTVSDLACQAFPQAKVQVLPDLAGKDRLLCINIKE